MLGQQLIYLDTAHNSTHFLHMHLCNSLSDCLFFKGNEAFQPVQTSLAPGDLVQSAVVVSSTPGGTVFLEPQAVTLTELPGGTVQTLPAGSTFEGNVTSVKVPITPKYFVCLNKSLHLFEMHCVFLN